MWPGWVYLWVDMDGCVFRKALINLEDGVMAPPTFQANHTYPDLHPSFVRKLAFPLTLFSTFLRHGGVWLLAGYRVGQLGGNGWMVVAAPKQ